MALTTLANVKLWLGIDVSDTANDALLTEILEGVEDSIEEFCDRDFTKADYTQFYLYESDLVQNLKLRNWPVDYIKGAWYGSDEIVDIKFNSAGTTFYQTYLDTTTFSVSNNLATNQYTLSDYVDLEALTDAIASDYSGFTFTWAANWYKQLPPWVIIPDSYNNADEAQTDIGLSWYGAVNPLRLTKTGERLFRLHFPTGTAFEYRHHKLAEGTPVVVRYNAGYATTPSALEVIAKKLIAGVWERSQAGSAVTSSGEEEEIGDYKIKGPSGAVLTQSSGSGPVKGLTDGLISKDILKDLAPYRNLDLY